MYSKDGGSNWETKTSSSTSDSYTFSGLSMNTTYSIRVKVVDVNNKESSVASTSVTTDKGTASLSATTSTIAIGSTTNYITYTGDGIVSCSPKSPSTATYASCSYNSTTKRITFTRTKVGSQSFTISATSGTNYNELSSTIVTVIVSGTTPKFIVGSTTATISSSSPTATVSYTYDGDGEVSCPSWGTYASCSVNTSTKVITFTWKKTGSQTITISASAGVNSSYASKTITVTAEAQNFATYIKSLYTSQGSNGIYYHTSSLANGAGDNSYRYAGESGVYNYVCFGSEEATCPEDNLYRIIGVFGNQVKLIKYTYAKSNLLGTTTMVPGTDSQWGGPRYYWSGSSSNTSNAWANSTLNTSSLNGTFLNSFSTAWRNKIATTSWKVGGVSGTNGYESNAKTAYNYEVGANSSSTTYSAKIGLMYLSDYYYAATPTFWPYPGKYNSEDVMHTYGGVGYSPGSDWMRSSYNEWTITRVTDYSDYVFTMVSSNGISRERVNNGEISNGGNVRPVFYLDSTVKISEGDGRYSSPYRIS